MQHNYLSLFLSIIRKKTAKMRFRNSISVSLSPHFHSRRVYFFACTLRMCFLLLQCPQVWKYHCCAKWCLIKKSIDSSTTNHTMKCFFFNCFSLTMYRFGEQSNFKLLVFQRLELKTIIVSLSMPALDTWSALLDNHSKLISSLWQWIFAVHNTCARCQYAHLQGKPGFSKQVPLLHTTMLTNNSPPQFLFSFFISLWTLT